MTWRGSPAAPRTSSATTCARCATPASPASRREHKIVFYALTDAGRATARRAPRTRRGHAMSSPSLELPILTVAAHRPPQQSRLAPAERDRLIRRAKALSWLSLAYMTAEGAIAIAAGDPRRLRRAARFRPRLRDRERSPRSSSSGASPAPADSPAAPKSAPSGSSRSPSCCSRPTSPRTRSARSSTGAPRTSWLGIGLSISSIIVMPLLGNAKHRIGRRLGSGATAGEGTPEHALRLPRRRRPRGLALNAALGLWWADPAVALASPSSRSTKADETWRGEGCCASLPIPGELGDDCHDDCCT